MDVNMHANVSVKTSVCILCVHIHTVSHPSFMNM